MTRRISVKWQDREVENPVARFVVGLVAIVGGGLGALLAVVVVVVMTPIAIVLHPVFRLFGRRGTIRSEGDSFHIGIDGEAFRRA